MDNPFTCKRLTRDTLLLEWPQEISHPISKSIRSFLAKLQSQNTPGIKETFRAYSSVAIHFDPDETGFEELCSEIEDLLPDAEEIHLQACNTWLIPVCYDERFADDLRSFSTAIGSSEAQVIDLHTSVEYLVHFIGFLPGFLYLGGLPQQLHLPRKSAPSLTVPKGAVAIGGAQTGIYPMPSPGGWHVIGRCPLDFFSVDHHPPCFILPGDRVRFRSIAYPEYKVIELEERLHVFDRTLIRKDG